MKLNRQPDAAQFARNAARRIECALGNLEDACDWCDAAGARNARTGIRAAGAKLRGWSGRLNAAASQREGERP